MPDPFNPFEKWLGLDPKIKNPHHFQLLGVSTRLNDPSDIQKAVETGVSKNLTQLAKIPPGQHDELIAKLKQRIAIAKTTLLDPQKRQSYIDLLKQRVQAKQKPSKSGTDSRKAESAKPTGASAKDAPTKPESSVPSTPLGENAAPPTSLPKANSVVKAIAPILPPPATTPIPMAVPVSGGAPDAMSAAVVAAPANPPMAGVVSEGLAVNADGVPIDDVRIEPTIRRKNSSAGFIIAVGMLITAGIGGFLIFQNWDALSHIAQVDSDGSADFGLGDGKSTAVANVDAGLLDPDDLDVTTEKDALPELDLTNIEAVNVDEIMVHPDTSGSTRRDPEFEKAYAERIKKRLEAMGFGDLDAEPVPDSNMPEVDPDTEKDTTDAEPGNAPEEMPEPETVPQPNVISLNQSQLARYRRHIERAKRSLYRREKSTATRSLKAAADVLDEVRKNETDEFEPDQAPIAQLVPETKEILDLIEGFWAQVVSSCQEIPGGQEIVIGEQIVAMIEADLQKFILRNAGSNITYEYYFCPPGLAVELGNQGTIPDIPTWSKQQAAFYAVNQIYGADYQRRIDDLLEVAEDAGHDCDGIRHFCKFEFGNVGAPEEKMEVSGRDVTDSALIAFRTENDYKDIRKLEPGVAGLLSEMLLQIDSPNLKQHVAFLEEARELAIRGGEVSKAEDAVIELGIYTDINQPELTCETFIDLAKMKLNAAQSRSLMERAIPFLKSEFGERSKLKSRRLLVKRLFDIAQQYGMIDASRRLSQLK